MPTPTHRLYYGDCLDILQQDQYFATESVDLIYLDPPFNSKRNYNIFYKTRTEEDRAQMRAFKDFWRWDAEAEKSYDRLLSHQTLNSKAMLLIESLRRFLGEADLMAYLVMMTERLVALHRVLKPTGSLYLHCDPTASHYLKIVLDALFGDKGFRNELIWHYRTGGVGDKHFARKHDIIYFYTKKDRGYRLALPKMKQYYDKKPSFADKEGGHDEKGYYNIVTQDDVWGYRGDSVSEKGGVNNGEELKAISNLSKEHLGYPTQKPVALLTRIILASSQKGDVVLDPFCGCGTTAEAALKLNRSFIGIDISHLAVGLVEHRLGIRVPEKPPMEVIGFPKSLAAAHDLFKRSPFQFEAWAVTRFAFLRPNERKVGDTGVDGEGRIKIGPNQYVRVLAQVKGGKNLGPHQVREFYGAMQAKKADIGLFIVLQDTHITQKMRTEAAKCGRYKAKGELFEVNLPRIDIWAIECYFKGQHPEAAQLQHAHWSQDR